MKLVSAPAFSAWQLLRHGLSPNRKWPRQWRDAELKPNYDVVIVGGGGHGLATAYYLAARHGVTNVAVIEKSWLGGGNTGRNTTVIRSNYFYPASAALYDLSVQLYEAMSRELNYNVMFSQRGMLVLAHTRHDEEMQARWSNALQLNGVDAEILDSSAIYDKIPNLNRSAEMRYPVRSGMFQQRGGVARHDAVAWAYARAASALGVDIVQNCEVTELNTSGGAITGVQTAKGRVTAKSVVLCASSHSGLLAETAGVHLPIQTYTLQAAVSEPLQPVLNTVVLSPGSGVYLSQSDKGELVIGGGLDLYCSYGQRASLPTLQQIMSGVLDLFPTFSRVRMLRTWGGAVDVVHDSSPLLGEAGRPGLYLNCGWGTGGFKSIPAGGYLTAEHLATGRQPDIAKPFSLDRFRTGAFLDEGAASGIAH